MYTIFGSSNVELCKEVGKIDTPKIAWNWFLEKKTFLSLDLHIAKNILQIGEAKVSKFKFMHTLFELKSIFAIEQKAIYHFMLCKKCCIFIETPSRNNSIWRGHLLSGLDVFIFCSFF